MSKKANVSKGFEKVRDRVEEFAKGHIDGEDNQRDFIGFAKISSEYGDKLKVMIMDTIEAVPKKDRNRNMRAMEAAIVSVLVDCIEASDDPGKAFAVAGMIEKVGHGILANHLTSTLDRLTTKPSKN